MEPGIILNNIGKYEEAIQELTIAEEAFGEATAHLSFAIGYALMMLKNHTEALERFERVVEEQPDYALANLYAARCSFALGEKARGIRYARTRAPSGRTWRVQCMARWRLRISEDSFREDSVGFHRLLRPATLGVISP